jgi:hypothetical protein
VSVVRRKPLTQRREGPGDILREPIRDQRSGAEREESHRGQPSPLICFGRPATADGGERRDGGKGAGHAKEHWSARSNKRLAGAAEHEGEHWEDARAKNAENSRQIRQNDKTHGRVPCMHIAAKCGWLDQSRISLSKARSSPLRTCLRGSHHVRVIGRIRRSACESVTDEFRQQPNPNLRRKTGLRHILWSWD